MVADLAQLLQALLLEDEELAKHQLDYAQREDDGNQRHQGEIQRDADHLPPGHGHCDRHIDHLHQAKADHRASPRDVVAHRLTMSCAVPSVEGRLKAKEVREHVAPQTVLMSRPG